VQWKVDHQILSDLRHLNGIFKNAEHYVSLLIKYC
jgi:hypothetical protein